MNSVDGSSVKKLVGLEQRQRSIETSVVNMSLGSEKVSIFEEEKGAHEMRFVSFNDLPEINSKYTK